MWACSTGSSLDNNAKVDLAVDTMLYEWCICSEGKQWSLMCLKSRNIFSDTGDTSGNVMSIMRAIAAPRLETTPRKTNKNLS
jgi:hypothetical protein